MSFVLLKLLRDGDTSDDLEKGYDSQIRLLLHTSVAVEFEFSRVLVLHSVVFRSELPNEKESITNVLVGRSTVMVHHSMYDFSDLVDEHHHTLLKYLSGIGEVTDVAEPENGHHLSTR